MALPAFLLNIDFYGITVALPSIGAAFGAGTTALQWAVNGFNLALAAPLVAFGRLGDVVGRRRALLAGVLLFALGSAVCGLAPNMAVLIAGRGLQGLAVALFSTSPLAIVAAAFAEPRRGLAFAVWAAVGAAGSAVGPLVGGALTGLLGWRWFFFVNLPVAALTVAVVLAVVPESRDEAATGRPLDLLGFALVTGGLGASVLGVQGGDDWGWASPGVAGSLVLGVVLLAGFAAVEARRADPLVDLALFRRPGYAAVLAVAVAGNFGFSAVIFFTALYLQNVLGLAPLAAGLVLVAFSACFVATLPVAGVLLPRAGARGLMLAGMALMAAAFLLFLPVAPAAGLGWVALALAVAGVGQGLAFNTTTTAGMEAASDARAGTASGVLNAGRQLGSTLGIAATGAVFQTIESRGLLAALRPQAGLDAAQEAVVRGLLSGSAAAQETLTKLAPALADRIDAVTAGVFGDALRGGMLLGALVSALGVAAAAAAATRSAAGRGR